MHSEKDHEIKPEELKWRTAEYTHKEREPHWYWILGTVAFVLFLFAFKQENYFFALFVILVALLLFASFRRVPPEFDCAIDARGVHCGSSSFLYRNLRGFAVRHREHMETDVLILYADRRINVYIKIPIYKDLVPTARLYLASHIAEFEYDETFADTLSDVLNI